MTINELREKYLQFFQEQGHAVIAGASLLPENDASVLFTTAGMHPLVPYLLGEKHPAGTRLVDCQKCIRTGDIDEVGDNGHLTFFEMLGNWSLGDYFKAEAIRFSWEFLTSPQWLGIAQDKLAVTVFAGDADAPRDEESAGIWQSLGLSASRIAYLGKENNWWGPAGQTGPCGPDTEMFYWTGVGAAPKEFDAEDSRWLEIWNDVFMQYDKQKRTILVDGMNCLYDQDFKINQPLLDLLNTYPVRKILVIAKHGNEATKLLAPLGFEIFAGDDEIKKDSQAFFEKLFTQFQLEPRATCYLEHKDENMKAAEAADVENIRHYDLREDNDLVGVKEFFDRTLDYYRPLQQKNVDTGMGLERTVAVLNGFDNVYEIPTLRAIYNRVQELARDKDSIRNLRIITDHVRAATFIIGDDHGVGPSNVDQGYVVRRLLRTAIRRGREIGIESSFLPIIAKEVIVQYQTAYPELKRNEQKIISEIKVEEEKFNKVLQSGTKELEEKFDRFVEERGKSAMIAYDKKPGQKIHAANPFISGAEAFEMYSSKGLPIEIIEKFCDEKGFVLDREEFENKYKEHQNLSRQGAEQKFKGGLADNSEQTTRLHTATHLLHAALRKILGEHVAQKGSNITAERLRFDFSHPDKLTEEQKQAAEKMVNQVIQENLPVTCQEMTVEEAKNKGALGLFNQKYGDKVKVYTVGDDKNPYSREICGGPHAQNTGELGVFKIKKEEASSAGIRRIKAVLE